MDNRVLLRLRAKRTRRFGAGLLAAGIASSWMGAVLGCASPGQPRPPSLQLPRLVDDLRADRIGDSVHLRWTTPSETTDKLPVRAGLQALLCRQAGADPGRGRAPCVAVKRVPVQPGASAAEDVLPPGLTSDPVGLLAYRVEILNAASRSAGRSGEAYAAAGSAPPPVEALAGTPVREGVRLHWLPGLAEAEIELDRLDLTGSPRPAKRPALPLMTPQTSGAETHLSARAAGKPDAGGTLDRSVQRGDSYRYTAQRVRTVVVEGHTMSLRSIPSGPVRVEVIDSFPPQPPTELRAAQGGGGAPEIDLSWEPGAEADLAGYNVYRAEAAGGATAWRRINDTPVAIPGFSDTTVRSGERYAYRVTAVDTRGHESAAGDEVQESVAKR